MASKSEFYLKSCTCVLPIWALHQVTKTILQSFFFYNFTIFCIIFYKVTGTSKVAPVPWPCERLTWSRCERQWTSETFTCASSVYLNTVILSNINFKVMKLLPGFLSNRCHSIMLEAPCWEVPCVFWHCLVGFGHFFHVLRVIFFILGGTELLQGWFGAHSYWWTTKYKWDFALYRKQ